MVKSDHGTPVLLKDVARIELGPDERRGITDLDGQGEVAGGITLQRFGSNALDVIDNVKKRMAELIPSLPEGTKIIPVYDRSHLIGSAIETLKHTLFEESVVVALVCIVFLLHVRSALVAILMLPVGILMAFGAMRMLGLGANIMSLGGIAIAIGAMIDGAVVMIENAHKHLERAAPGAQRREVLIEAAKEVGPALFFSLLVITVSFTADLHPGVAGGAPLRPAGLHQNLLDGRCGDPIDHACPGPDGVLHPWEDHRRAQEPGESGADLALSADHPGRASPQGRDARRGSRDPRRECHPGTTTRQRVYAEPE